MTTLIQHYPILSLVAAAWFGAGCGVMFAAGLAAGQDRPAPAAGESAHVRARRRAAQWAGALRQ